jgi:hypothetical protein
MIPIAKDGFGLLPFKHEVSLTKKQCPKTPQEEKHMKVVSYASVL